MINIKAALWKDNKMWCITYEDNFLYCVEKGNNVMKEITMLSDEDNMKVDYVDILQYGKCFVFIPSLSKDILILNTEDWTKRYIKIQNVECNVGNGKTLFFTGKIQDDYLFLFGNSYAGIVKVDLLTGENKIINDWARQLKGKYNDKDDGCFHMQYIQLDNFVYIPFMNLNAVLRLNVITDDVEICRVGDDRQRYIAIESDGENLWLIPRDVQVGEIVCWNLETGAVQQFKEYPLELVKVKHAFYRTEMIENNLLVFSHMGNCNIAVDTKTGKMRKLKDVFDVLDENGCRYPFVWKYKNHIVVLRNAEIIFWDYFSDDIEKYSFVFGERCITRYEDRQIRQYFCDDEQMIIRGESEKKGLSEYIKFIKIL